MTVLTRLVAVLLLSFFAALPATAQTKDLSSRVAKPTSFLEACAEKIEERGRLRFCDTYFREKLGNEADALLYLRDRITRLRAAHETAAGEKYSSFLNAVYIVAFLTIVSIVLVASDRKINGLAKWASLISCAALLVLIVVTALGWLGKYRAEYAAQVELGILRDRIETEAAQAIATGQTITPAIVRDWTTDFQEIGRRFAESYGKASRVPEFERFHSN